MVIEAAQNVVMVGYLGAGRSYLATAIGVCGIARYGKRVCFCSTVDLVNALEWYKRNNKAEWLAASMLCLDTVILYKQGYLPFSQAGGVMLFHLLGHLLSIRAC